MFLWINLYFNFFRSWRLPIIMSNMFRSSKQDFTFGPWKVTVAKNHIMKSKDIERWVRASWVLSSGQIGTFRSDVLSIVEKRVSQLPFRMQTFSCIPLRLDLVELRNSRCWFLIVQLLPIMILCNLTEFLNIHTRINAIIGKRREETIMYIFYCDHLMVWCLLLLGHSFSKYMEQRIKKQIWVFHFGFPESEWTRLDVHSLEDTDRYEISVQKLYPSK